MRGLDPIRRRHLYAQAIEENDFETIAAFERGHARTPETAEKSDRLQRLATIYRGAVSAVKGDVIRRVPPLDNREAEKL